MTPVLCTFGNLMKFLGGWSLSVEQGHTGPIDRDGFALLPCRGPGQTAPTDFAAESGARGTVLQGEETLLQNG